MRSSAAIVERGMIAVLWEKLEGLLAAGSDTVVLELRCGGVKALLLAMRRLGNPPHTPTPTHANMQVHGAGPASSPKPCTRGHAPPGAAAPQLIQKPGEDDAPGGCRIVQGAASNRGWVPDSLRARFYQRERSWTSVHHTCTALHCPAHRWRRRHLSMAQ